MKQIKLNRRQRRAADNAAREAQLKASPNNNPTITPSTIPSSPEEVVERIKALYPDLYPKSPHSPNDGVICGDPECPTCADLDDPAEAKSEETGQTKKDDEQQPSPQPAPKRELSEARLEANRRAAEASTGPRTSAGKAKVSRNAVTTALTGRTVLLPFDNIHAYTALLEDYLETFQPVGPIEKGLVQSLVDTAWRLERIPGLEYALIENGHNAMGYKNPEMARNSPEISLELVIRLNDERNFRNLHLQEGRLVRRREKELKELRELQAARKANEEAELKQAAELALVAEQDQQPFDVSSLRFVFSTERFTKYMARLTPSMKQTLLKEALGTAARAA